MNTSRRLPPEYVDALICAFNRRDYDCIIAGWWLRDFLILRDSFDPTKRAMTVYIRPQYGKVVREDNLKKDITDAVRDAFLQVSSKECGEQYFMDLTGTRAKKYTVDVPYMPPSHIHLTIRMILDPPESFPTQFVIGLDQCSYDGEKYRLFPGFTRDYEQKTITLYPHNDKNRNFIATKLARVMTTTDYEEYTIEHDDP